MTLQHDLAMVVSRILQEVCSCEEMPEVVSTAHEQFGHYQCNSCLKLAKTYRCSPKELATRLMNAMLVHAECQEMFSRIEVAGPGFINMTLASAYVQKRLVHMIKDPFLGVSRPKVRKRVVVEFSSPNVAKELHVGHLRSTIIGDAIARILEFLGEDVLRLNHIGDFGTQFGMLIQFLHEQHPLVLTGQKHADLSELMQWYRASKTLFDEDPAFKKRAQLRVVDLQRKEKITTAAWETICQISRASFEEIYRLLDIKIIERGESFYGPYLEQIVQDLEQKKLIHISQGAKCIFLRGITGRDGEPLPLMVQKSDGGFNYDTTDMAALWHRVHVEKVDRIIILTDAGQSLHFQMVFQAGALAGYYDPQRIELNHVGFGVVLGSNGKKFKTRSGDTEKLMDLLQEAIRQARIIMEERLPDATAEEKEQAARILGIDAIKYADLSGNRIKDYTFSYERMLQFEGNTAAFLLYAFVRIHGIKRKLGFAEKHVQPEDICLEHPSELALGVHLCQFAETLFAVAKDLLPNRLADYLYALAEKFHVFYRDCRVEGVPQERGRLMLCEMTGRVLEQGLTLLGCKTLSRM